MKISSAEVGRFTDATRASIWQLIAYTKECILQVADTFRARDNRRTGWDHSGREKNYVQEPGVVVCTALLLPNGHWGCGHLTFEPTVARPANRRRFRIPFFSRGAPPPRDETHYQFLYGQSLYGDTYEIVRDDEGVVYAHTDANGSKVRWREDSCGNVYIDSCGKTQLPSDS